MAPIRWTLQTTLWATLWCLPAMADEPACRREADGRVSCSAAGFQALTDRCVDLRARAESCEVRLPEVNLRAGELTRSLAACEAARAVSVTPTPAATSSARPILVLALGVAGSFASASSIFATTAPDGVRIALGVGGLSALSAAVLAAVWP
jgi:hypothetical protein